MNAASEIAPAKLNLALHVRGRMPDGRHSIETIFAFCVDGDRLTAGPANGISLEVNGPFATDLDKNEDNLVLRAARSLAATAQAGSGAELVLEKRLPIASGIGGGSADAAATLRLLTSLWQIDPKHAQELAPSLGSDVPACLLSLTARGMAAGDSLTTMSLPGLSGTPVLLVNPRIPLRTDQVFAGWDGRDRGPLTDWREGRNDLEESARTLAPEIGSVIAWLAARPGSQFVRMSGSGATCFALFDSEEARDSASAAVPSEWWRLASFLR